MSTTDEDSIPMLPPESPGSSVSTTLQEEYNELLKYAVITPHFDPSKMPTTLAEAANAYQPRPRLSDNLLFQESQTGSTDSSVSDPVERRQSVMAVQGSSASSKDVDDSLASSIHSERATIHSERATIHSERATDDILQQSQGINKTPVRPHAIMSPEVTPSSDGESNTEKGSPESFAQSPVVDPDMARMEAQLDNWCLQLKRNVMAEFSQSKIALIERQRKEIRLIRDRHSREINQLQNEMGNLKELILTYEQTVERKDHVITNLTRAVQKQKDRFEMLRRFEAWKLRHSEDRREAFTSRLAQKHHEHRLKTKVWSSWHSIIEAKWRQRVEKACQSKAQDVCMKLTNDYEATIASLNEALESSRTEVNELHKQREHYEETMKKAFMRGVCALNLEAMSMFHDGEEQEVQQGHTQHPGNHNRAPPTSHLQNGFHGTSSESQPTQPTFSAVHSQVSSSGGLTSGSGVRIITSESATTPATVTQTQSRGQSTRKITSRTSNVQRQPQVLKAKVSASASSSGRNMGCAGLAPPMSSIVVERHHPITQQTVGHATAAKYPVHPGHSVPHGARLKSNAVPSRGTSKQPQGVMGRGGLHTVRVVH